MKRRKVLTSIIIATILLLSSTVCVYAKEGEKLPKGYVVVNSSLRLREKPATDSKVLESLEPGTLVTIQDTQGSWYKVEIEGTIGYVKSDYVVIPEKDTSEYELVSAAVITAKNSSKNRNFNMAKACETINTLVLEPKEQFDWYGEGGVGQANKANGYKESTVIEGGKYVKGYGGGVCQVSTSVYSCIYKLGIVPDELHHHSLKSSYVKEGMDATVSYSSDSRYMKNFVFTNTLNYTLTFEAYTDGGRVVVLAYKNLNN